jgi:hypothetical protein
MMSNIYCFLLFHLAKRFFQMWEVVNAAIVWLLDLNLLLQSVHITNKVETLIHAHLME